MPAKDESRWTQNDDGSWSRFNAQGDEERTFENPNATDGAREYAAEYGVDLSTVEGSGADGRITKADVEAVLKEEA